MNLNARTLLKAVGIAAIPFLAAGCRTTLWSEEKQTIYRLERHLNAWQVLVQDSVANVHKAALAGLKDLKIEPITNRVDKVSGLIDGMFSDNMDFEIRLEALAPRLTRVRIKCGMFGNEARAKLLFQAMQKHL